MDLSLAFDDIGNWLNALAAPVMAGAVSGVGHPDDGDTDPDDRDHTGVDVTPMTMASVSDTGPAPASDASRTDTTETVQPSTTDGVAGQNNGPSPLPIPEAIPATETLTNRVTMLDRSRRANTDHRAIELPDRPDGPRPAFDGMLPGSDTTKRNLGPGPGPAAIEVGQAKLTSRHRADSTTRPNIENASAPSPSQPSQTRTARQAMAATSSTPTEATITAALTSMFDQPAAWSPSPAAAKTPVPTVAPSTVATRTAGADGLEDLADQLALHLEDTGLALGRLELER